MRSVEVEAEVKHSHMSHRTSFMSHMWGWVDPLK